MSWATVEAAVRPRTLAVGGRTNVVFRGLVFEHAANCFNTTSATVTCSTNVLVDSIHVGLEQLGRLRSLRLNQRHRSELRGQLQRRGGLYGYPRSAISSSIPTRATTTTGAARRELFYDWAASGGTKFFADAQHLGAKTIFRTTTKPRAYGSIPTIRTSPSRTPRSRKTSSRICNWRQTKGRSCSNTAHCATAERV